MATTVYFSLGTNLGEKERNIKEALLAINKNIGEVIHCSNPYENSAWGFTSENLLKCTVLFYSGFHKKQLRI